MTDETPTTPNDNADLSGLQLRPLAGSERKPAADAQPAEPLDPTTDITITVVLRRRGELPPEALSTPIARDELAANYGADPADLDLVTSTLTGLGLAVTEADAPSRRVRVTGSIGRLSQVFGADLSQVTSTAPSGSQVTHRHRTGGLSVPAQLDGIVTAVLGLDDRPQTRAKFRLAGAAAASKSYTPPQLGTVYNFPTGTDGSGQTVAIIELGGGYQQADLDAYFSGLGITGPTVTAVGVDGASNAGGNDPQGADGEVLLDIEVVGALASAAKISVYFAPNTDAGFLDAISQAAHASPAPAAISISWGQSEDDWTAQARDAFDAALADACALGVTVTAASGDDGSTDRATDGKSHADFPAASPHALACGGTRLDADPATGAVTSEVVWNNGAGQGASGGGVSDTFAQPVWQAHAGVPSINGKTGRGVPDVAGDADPQTGYRVRIDGTDTVIGGTSAVAPLWAALIARLAQATGRTFGLLQPVLYGTTAAGAVAPGFRDITSGDNGAYQAGAGWDACTGLGVPDGTALLAALQNAGPAPTPGPTG